MTSRWQTTLLATMVILAKSLRWPIAPLTRQRCQRLQQRTAQHQLRMSTTTGSQHEYGFLWLGESEAGRQIMEKILQPD